MVRCCKREVLAAWADRTSNVGVSERHVSPWICCPSAHERANEMRVSCRVHAERLLAGVVHAQLSDLQDAGANVISELAMNVHRPRRALKKKHRRVVKVNPPASYGAGRRGG